VFYFFSVANRLRLASIHTLSLIAHLTSLMRCSDSSLAPRARFLICLLLLAAFRCALC